MTKEEKMREANPGLKDAWEKYQMLLQLYDDGSYEDDLSGNIAFGYRALVSQTGMGNIVIGKSAGTIYDN